jgi:hypothetical protein
MSLMWSLCFNELMEWRGNPDYIIDPNAPCVNAIIMPTQKQARAIHWDALTNMLKGHPLVKSINNSRMVIKFKGNRPDLVLLGANDGTASDKGKGGRGFSFTLAQLDEYQDFNPGVLDTVIMPALTRNRGWQCRITGTPKGKLHHFYKLRLRAEEFNDIYSYHHYFTTDNPTIDPAEVDKARLILPDAIFRQEYLATWEDYPGKFYSELSEENRVDSLPAREDFDIVVLGVDHGELHPAHVVLGRCDGVWYYLDGWSPMTGLPVPEDEQNENLVHLAQKWRITSTYCDPSRPSRILTIRGLGAKYDSVGLMKAVAGFNKILPGIAEVHSLIHQRRLMFARDGSDNENRSQAKYISSSMAYDMMGTYHRKTNPMGDIVDEVAPNQDDHLCDALRYALATGKPLV